MRPNNVENIGVRVNVKNVRSQWRRLQDGREVYVAEVLVVIQYCVLDVRNECIRSVVV